MHLSGAKSSFSTYTESELSFVPLEMAHYPKSVAEELHMIESKGCNPTDNRLRHNVGGIQAASKTNFENGHIHALIYEDFEACIWCRTMSAKCTPCMKHLVGWQYHATLLKK